MHLYLVQHGEAKSKDVDPDRGLTDEGFLNVEKAAATVKLMGLSIDSIWHSGKTRARETAEIFHSSIVAPCELFQRDGLSPNDPVEAITQVIAAGGIDVMIVGHLPFLNKTVSLLVAGNENADIITFQNGGVLCLECDETDHWSVSWMIVPEILK